MPVGFGICIKHGVVFVMSVKRVCAFNALPVILAAVIVSSCGGGTAAVAGSQQSGGTVNSPPAASEAANSFGLGRVNAEAAHNMGITGAGVVLGLIDAIPYWQSSSGTAVTHSELQGQLLTPATDNAVREMQRDGSRITPIHDEFETHGLIVGGIMVARNDNSGVRGIAYGARLRAMQIPTAMNGVTNQDEEEEEEEEEETQYYSPIDPDGIAEEDQVISTAITAMVGHSDLFAINNSWGVEGIVTAYSETVYRNNLPRTIAAIAQAGTMQADRKVFVWSAGNAHGSAVNSNRRIAANSPEVYPGMIARISELQGHSLVVASVDRNGVISSFSNRCGISAAHCLVAPGEIFDTSYSLAVDTRNANNTQAYSNHSGNQGSSFSAPLVTGALALLKQRFPTMGNHQLVSRLLATATKTGRYADSAIYGQGLLNVSAGLTMAVGPVSIRLGRSLSDSAAYGMSDSSLRLSSSLASLRASASAHEIEAYDTLGTPFRHSLSSWLSSEDGSDDALQRLLAARTLDARMLRHGENSYAVGYSGMDMNGREAYGSKHWFSLGDKGLWFGSGPGARRHHYEPMFSGIHGFSSPFTGMAEGGFAFGMEGKAFADSVWQLESYVPGTHHSSLDSVNTLGLVASLSSFTGDSPWRFSTGMLREGDSVLSNSGTGAFAGLGATTWHGGMDLAHHFGAWSGYVSGHFGMTSGSSSSGLWRGVESVRSSSWALGLVRREVFSGDDAVGVRVVQTLRAEGGSAHFLLPDSRDRYDNLYSKGVSLSAEPGGREVDMALSWQKALSDGGSFSMDLGVTTEPGHVAGGSSRVWSGLAWVQRF